MGHRFEWIIPDHIFAVSIIDTLTEADVPVLTARLHDILDHATTPVYALYDIAEMRRLPKLNLITRDTVEIFGKLGHLVVIGEVHGMLSFLLKTISQFSNCQLSDSPTREAALVYLSTIDVRLAQVMKQHAASVMPPVLASPSMP